MTDYYAGGVRIMQDGVPCRVARVCRANADFKARMALVLAGEIDWEPMEQHPAFSFTPAERLEGKRRPVAKPAPKCSPAAKSYYAGGYRKVLGGVPVRLARVPSPNGLKQMRETARGFDAGKTNDAVAKREQAYRRDQSGYVYAAA